MDDDAARIEGRRIRMPRTAGPTIRRWQLGQELRRHREAAGVSASAAAAELELGTPALSKIEAGKQSIKGTYVKLLAAMYRLPTEERSRLLELTAEANQPGWWVTYGKLVPDWFKMFLGYEGYASDLDTYGSELVHGLLQTEDYIRAIARVTNPGATDAELDRQVDLRRERQERVSGDNPPSLRVVLNESVLQRKVGGREVMLGQLNHLLEASELPHVTIQVLKFESGAHPAMTAPFTMLGFESEPEMNCVYLENGRGALYLERKPDLERYAVIFRQLTEQALDPHESRMLMDSVVQNL
jgi:transcriptional regulator with XRE-family HTH domain